MNPDKYLLGDATTLLKSLPSRSVELIITDPAYSSLEKWRAMGTTTRLKQSTQSSNDWFPVVPNSYFKPFFKECYRVLRDPAHLYVMCDDETAYAIREDIEEAGFEYRKKIIWRKVGKKERVNCPHCGREATTKRRAGQPGMGYPYRSSYEVILLAQKGARPAPTNRSVRDFIDVKDWPDEASWQPDWVDLLDDVHECGRIKPSKHGDEVYPTQKPLSILKTLIGQSSEPGDRVLDPFAGSGATLVAAAQEGRDYLGFDVLDKARDFCAAREEWYGLGEAKRPDAVVEGRVESDIFGLFGG